jgi:hypothetical protein
MAERSLSEIDRIIAIEASAEQKKYFKERRQMAATISEVMQGIARRYPDGS